MALFGICNGVRKKCKITQINSAVSPGNMFRLMKWQTLFVTAGPSYVRTSHRTSECVTFLFCNYM